MSPAISLKLYPRQAVAAHAIKRPLAGLRYATLIRLWETAPDGRGTSPLNVWQEKHARDPDPDGLDALWRD